MKHLSFMIAAALVAGLVSCNKSEPTAFRPEDEATGEEIVLNLEGDLDVNIGIDTKATAINDVPSPLYWGATTGTSTEASKYACASASVSSSKIATGKYQTAPATAYNYYVSNSSFTVGSSTTIAATNTTDIVAGRASSTTSTTPAVTMNHIFARTGSFTFSNYSGYTVSNVSYTIVGKSTINGTAGTYNMTTSAWTAASTKLSSATAITGSSDMYLIPGTYTIACTFTLKKGDFTKTYTKSCDASLVAGKINNFTVSCTVDEAVQIQIGVSLTAWANNAVALSFS